MADRGLSAGSITDLGGDVTEFYHLVHIDLTIEALYYTDAPYDIDYGGNTYLSNALITGIPDAKELLGITPASFDLGLAGSDELLHGILIVWDYKNAPVYIYRHIVSTAQSVLFYEGVCDRFKKSRTIGGNTSKITLTITNHWSDWEAVNGREISDKAQQSLYSGDLGLEFAGVTDSVLGYWGNSQIFSLRSQVAEVVESLANPYKYESARSSMGVLPVIYGQRKVKGIPVYRYISGVGLNVLHVVYALAEGECDSLVNVGFYFGNKITDSAHADLNGTVLGKYFHTGSTTQAADATLVAAAPAWTTAHRLRGICYVIVEYDSLLYPWNGEPEPVFEIKGKTLYDTRTSLTAYSTNNALAVYDFLTNTSYGKSLASSKINTTLIDAGANYCDVLKTDHDAGSGGTPVSIKRFELNGVMDNTVSIKKNMESLLFSMNAHLPWISGQYSLVIERDDDTSIYSFDETNIRGAFDVYEAGIKELANRVHLDWTDPEIDEGKAVEVSESASYLSADLGRVLKKKITLEYERNRYRAKNRAATELKKTRQQVRVKLQSSNADSLQVETGNVVDVTSAEDGWTAKLFRVDSMKMGKGGTNTFELSEYEPTVYDWSVSVEDPPPANSEITNPNSIAVPTGMTVTATDTEALASTDGSTTHRLKVAWTSSLDGFVRGYNVQYRENGATNWIDYQDALGQSASEIMIDAALVGVAYDVRIRAYNGLGISSAWVTATNVTVTGTGVVGVENVVVATNAYSNASYFLHEEFNDITSYTSQNASTVRNGYVTIKGDGTLPGYLYTLITYQTVGSLTWAKDRRIQFTLFATGWTLWTISNHVITGDIANGGFGIVFAKNGTSYDAKGFTIDSVGATTLTTFSTFSTTATHAYECIFTAGVGVDFYIDGSSVGTITTTLPTGTTSAIRTIDCNNGNSVLSQNINIADFFVVQDQ